MAQDRRGSSARLRLPGGRRLALRLRVPGLHNVRNAAMAVGAVLALEADVEPALAALAEFQGVGRRFEAVGGARGWHQRSKVSMTTIRPPQQGHGGRGSAGSSG